MQEPTFRDWHLNYQVKNLDRHAMDQVRRLYTAEVERRGGSIAGEFHSSGACGLCNPFGGYQGHVALPQELAQELVNALQELPHIRVNGLLQRVLAETRPVQVQDPELEPAQSPQ